MNPTIYALCQKPVLGFVLFVTNACSFPPLIADVPLSLVDSRTSAAKEFEVPVDKFYFFDLKFQFSSVDAVLQDRVIGDGSNYGKHCEGEGRLEDITPSLKAGAGRPIPIQVIITKAGDEQPIVDHVFLTMCRYASDAGMSHAVWRKIGRVHLAPGRYHVVIKNLEAQSGLDRVTTTVSLVAGHGK